MKSPQNKLIYTLHSGTAGDRVVAPSGESSFKIKFELQDDNDDYIKDYNVSFDGKLIFTGDDYAWIKTIEDSGDTCQSISIEMTDSRCGGTNIYERAIIKISDGEYNVDKCMVAIPVSATDLYENFNAFKGDELNIFDASGTRISAQYYGGLTGIEFDTLALPSTTFDFDHQAFDYFPNKNGEYPDFGTDYEDFFDTVVTPTALFAAGSTSYDSENLDIHAITGEYKIYDGTIPYHPAGAGTVAAQGWRLCYSQYKVTVTGLGTRVYTQTGKFIWCRLFKLIPTGSPALPGWIYDSTIGAYDKYARKPLLNKKSRDIVYSGAGPNAALTPYNPTIDNLRISVEMVNSIVGYTSLGDGQRFGQEATPQNGILLNDIITACFAHCCPGLTVVSNFFQINPTAPSANNPVTGQPSTTNNIVVFQKSDLKRPFDSNRATIGNHTTDELMKWLLEMFKVKMRITDTHVYIEDRTSPFFNNAVVMDLTTAPLNRMLAGANIYFFDKSDLPAKETFEFMDTKPGVNIVMGFGPQSDFVGAYLLYDGNCVNRTKTSGIKDHQLSRVTTDLEYIISAGPLKNETGSSVSTISDDGFVFLSTTLSGGVYTVQSLPPIIAPIDQLNNVMGWAYLHDMFFRTEANAKTGYMNNSPITFDSTKYIRQTKNLPIILCCIADFDPYAFVNWLLGEGIIKSAEYTIYDGTMKLQLMHQY